MGITLCNMCKGTGKRDVICAWCNGLGRVSDRLFDENLLN
jgi:DnaJ-class molecular chaperone